MIIKGLFRRYERWNPVHPSTGAFWGMGIGIGCGVGWGPGFGPEVVGYVGAGCGVGFSVGFTFLGFGIGLPSNYVYTTPYKALSAMKNSAIEIARSNCLLDMRSYASDGWSNFRPCICGLQQEAYETFQSFRIGNPLEKGIDMSNIRNAIFSSTKPVVDQFERIRCHLFRQHKGSSE